MSQGSSLQLGAVENEVVGLVWAMFNNSLGARMAHHIPAFMGSLALYRSALMGSLALQRLAFMGPLHFTGQRNAVMPCTGTMCMTGGYKAFVSFLSH
jgi:hypothetical protein